MLRSLFQDFQKQWEPCGAARPSTKDHQPSTPTVPGVEVPTVIDSYKCDTCSKSLPTRKQKKM